MSDENKQEISENFTLDIEATIDDLFTPAKEIEIDPLTNEVKEKSTPAAEDMAPSQEEPEKIQAMADSEILESGSNIASKDEPVTASPGENKDISAPEIGLDEDDFLEMEIEEIPPESKPDDKDESEEPPQYLQQEDPGPIVDKLLTTVMSLEWEIEDETLHAAITSAEALEHHPSLHEIPEATRLVSQVAELLAIMRHKPDLIPEAPAALKRAVGAIKDTTEGSRDTTSLSESQEELGNLLKIGTRSSVLTVENIQHEDNADKETKASNAQPEEVELKPSEEVEELSFELEMEQPEKKEDEDKTTEPAGKAYEQTDAVEPEPVGPVPPREAPPVIPTASRESTVATEQIDMPPEERTPQPEHPAVAQALRTHVAELDKLIERIKPVELLLSKTSGMDKLHVFQRGVRQRLEKQKGILEKILDGVIPAMYDADSTYVRQHSDTPTTTSRQPEPCPWTALKVVKVGNEKIAFPSVDVAFAGTIAGRFRKKLNNSETFVMSWLKPWPWVKIKPSLSGPLSECEEKDLKEMKLEIINSKLEQETGNSYPYKDIKNPIIIILHGKNNTNGVFIAKSTPEDLAITDENPWTRSPANSSLEAGSIEKDGEKIKIITLSGPK